MEYGHYRGCLAMAKGNIFPMDTQKVNKASIKISKCRWIYRQLLNGPVVRGNY